VSFSEELLSHHCQTASASPRPNPSCAVCLHRKRESLLP
jgi:hypothetical protein